MAADVRPNSVIKFARFELLKRFKKRFFLMKLFLAALLLMFVIKGVTYILFPNFVQHTAHKLLDCPSAHLVVFGWILVIVSAVAWLGWVRYMPG